MTSIDNYNNKVEYLENEPGNRNCGEEVTWSKVTKKENRYGKKKKKRGSLKRKRKTKRNGKKRERK